MEINIPSGSKHRHSRACVTSYKKLLSMNLCAFVHICTYILSQISFNRLSRRRNENKRFVAITKRIKNVNVSRFKGINSQACFSFLSSFFSFIRHLPFFYTNVFCGCAYFPRLWINVLYARGNLPGRDKSANWDSDRWCLEGESKGNPKYPVTRVYRGG